MPLIVQLQSERGVCAGTSTRMKSWPLCLHARGTHAMNTQICALLSLFVTAERESTGVSVHQCNQAQVSWISKQPGFDGRYGARAAYRQGLVTRHRLGHARCQVGDRGLVSVPTSLSAGLSVGPRGPRDASGEICSQRRTKCVKRTWFSMAAAAHRVTVAVGALECPFGPSWHRKKGPPPGKCALRMDGARVRISSSSLMQKQKSGPSSFQTRY